MMFDGCLMLFVVVGFDSECFGDSVESFGRHGRAFEKLKSSLTNHQTSKCFEMQLVVTSQRFS